MSKINSKYFSDVVSKLIAMKRKENITIDDKFKNELKGKLLNGINVTKESEKSGNFEGNIIGDFLRRWKYVLVAVPSAFVIMFVAAKMMELPVEINTDVVKPVINDEQTQNENEAGEDTEYEEKNIAGEEDERESKLKTFPGRLVLPKEYLEQDNTDFFELNVSDENIVENDRENYEEPASAPVYVPTYEVNMRNEKVAEENEDDKDDDNKDEKVKVTNEVKVEGETLNGTDEKNNQSESAETRVKEVVIATDAVEEEAVVAGASVEMVETESGDGFSIYYNENMGSPATDHFFDQVVIPLNLKYEIVELVARGSIDSHYQLDIYLADSEVVTKFYVYDNGKWFEIDDPNKDQDVEEAVEQENVSNGAIHYTTNRFDYTVNRPDQGYTVY